VQQKNRTVMIIESGNILPKLNFVALTSLKRKEKHRGFHSQ